MLSKSHIPVPACQYSEGWQNVLKVFIKKKQSRATMIFCRAGRDVSKCVLQKFLRLPCLMYVEVFEKKVGRN
jgi:hypothetical protein